jgi:hypothetical protein
MTYGVGQQTDDGLSERHCLPVFHLAIVCVVVLVVVVGAVSIRCPPG